MSKSAPTGTQSVLRAVTLLKTLAREGRGMDLAELGAAVGLARTTTHRLLSALESEGLVARDAGGHAYRLGAAAISLGAQALRGIDLRELARPHLEALARSTGESVTLEILSDARTLILDEVPGPHLVGATRTIGTTWDLHATATGKVLLAAATPAERKRLLSGRLPRMTASTLVKKQDVERQLEAVRERGYATNWEELEAGFCAAAAPVVDGLGQVVAAISAGAPTARVSRRGLEEMGSECARVAAALSEILGYRKP